MARVGEIPLDQIGNYYRESRPHLGGGHDA